MTITIRLKTDNDAFDDRDSEIGRILRRIAAEWPMRGGIGGKLFDSNGNSVGSMTVTGK